MHRLFALCGLPLSALLIAPHPSVAQENFPLFIIQAEPIFDAHGKGMLAELHEQVMDYAKLSPDTEIFPARRASRRFEVQPESVLFPAVQGACYAVPHLESLPLIISRRLLITRKAEGVAQDLRALQGKRLGIIRGFQYNLDSALLQAIELEQTGNLTSLYRMLIKGRIDAFIADPVFLQLQAGSLGIDLNLLSFDSQYPVDWGAIVYSLQDTPANRQRLASINQAIGRLHATPQASGLPDALHYLLPTQKVATLKPICDKPTAKITTPP